MNLLPMILLSLLLVGCTSRGNYNLATAESAEGQTDETFHASSWDPYYEYGYELPQTPFQLGVAAHYQLFNYPTKVRGVSLGIASAANKNVKGIALAGFYNRQDEMTGLRMTLGANATASRFDGLAIGLVNRNERARGILLGPLYNDAEDSFSGIALSLINNFDDAEAQGIAVSGIASLARTMTGIQVSGLVSYVEDNASGIQLSGLVNHVQYEAAGLQVAGIWNHAEEVRNGIQLAGIVNVVSGKVSGLQGACIINATEGEVRGVQVAAINKAERVRGIQFGLSNDAQELQGIQIGLFNFKGKRMRFPFINVGF